MPIEKLLKKIEKEAEDAAAKIREDTEKTKQSILNDAEKQRISIITYAKREAAELKKRKKEAIVEESKIELSKKLLNEKNKILGDVFKRAGIMLKNRDKFQYIKDMEHLLKAFVKTGNEKIVLDRSETRITSQDIENFNRKNGWKLSLSPEKEEMGGGFKLIGNKTVIDISYPRLFMAVGEEVLPKLVKILFEE